VHLEFDLEPGQRIDTAISEKYPQYFSRTLAQKLIKDGKVFIDDEICKKSSHKEDHGKSVKIHYEPSPEYNLHANHQTSVPIIFQDRHLAIIHKPAGMTVHPGSGTGEDTLVHVLLAQIDRLSEGSDKLRPGIVHRLDRETEGLMVIAKDNRAHFELASQFSERKVLKEYHGWVWGVTNPLDNSSEQIVEGFIGRHPKDRKKMLFEHFPLHANWKTARMSFTTLKTTKYFSLIKINLQTGRTHQIRATMAKMEHPVLGDTVYSHVLRRLSKTSILSVQKEQIINGGLFLMATRLSFIHPVTKELLDFQLPLPERFININSIL